MKLYINRQTGNICARIKTGNPAKPRIRISLGTSDAQEAAKKAKTLKLEEQESALQIGAKMLQTAAHLAAGKKVTVQSAREEWLKAAHNRDESPATTAKNATVMAQWIEAENLGKLPPLALTEAHVSRFINRSDDASYATRVRQLSVIRMFLGFCGVKGYVGENVAGKGRMAVQHRKLSQAQLEPHKVEPMTAAEVQLIMENTTGFMRWGTGIAFAAGLRLGDVAQLQHASIVPGHLIVHTGKRNKRVKLPINERLAPGLAAALAHASAEFMAIDDEESPYLFPDAALQYADVTAGRPKFSIYYQRMLARVGIENRSFHSLRHAAITRWAKIGFSIEECAEYAGHSNTATTKGYIA
jgi:integrase